MASQCTCGAEGGSGGGAQQKKLLKRKTTKKGEKENPYSDRGVEKFSALLAELEEKKKTIYSKFSPEEVSLIRFVHDSDNSLKPVVVRAKSSKFASKTKEAEEQNPMEEQQETQKKMEIVEPVAEGEEKTNKRLSMEAVISGVKANLPWMSDYKVRVGVILVLLLLVAILGRYWKKYYLLQLQATVCPRIETE